MAATTTLMRPRPSPSNGNSVPPPVKRPRRALLGRLSTGHWLMVGCGLLAFAFTATALRTDTPTVQVALAARDLAPGTPLTATDVTFAHVPADSVLAATVLTDTDLNVELRTGERIAAGDPILRSAISDDGLATAGRRSMSIPIDQANAVGGTLQVGDQVDVVAVFGDQARFILTDTTVLALSGGDHGSGLLQSSVDSYFVTVEVDAAGALAVAEALDAGTLQIIQASGADPIRPTGTPTASNSTANPTAGEKAATSASTSTTGAAGRAVSGG